jgi:hypothetical protein
MRVTRAADVGKSRMVHTTDQAVRDCEQNRTAEGNRESCHTRDEILILACLDRRSDIVRNVGAELP